MNEISGSNSELIVDTILEFGKTIQPHQLIPTLFEEASQIFENNSFAFALAAVLDRGTKSEIIWTIPYYLEQKTGKLEPQYFVQRNTDELEDLFRSLPAKPRYLRDAPRTVQELSRIVVEEYGGDTAKIWQGKTAEQVKETFRRVFGVGPGISSMIVLLLERCLSVQYAGTDHAHMDVKADVHIKRVFHRLGFVSGDSEAEAIQAARKFSPDYPGALDAPTWLVGKQWCKEGVPLCRLCPLREVCPSSTASTPVNQGLT